MVEMGLWPLTDTSNSCNNNGNRDGVDGGGCAGGMAAVGAKELTNSKS